MTPAEELRQAAVTIRARAGVAGPHETWVTLDDYPHEVWIAEPADRESMDEDMVAGCTYPAHAAHIATWSPPVALAVAAWLDVTADGVEAVDEIAAARGFVTHHRRTGEEWTLARLINASSTGSDA